MVLVHIVAGNDIRILPAQQQAVGRGQLQCDDGAAVLVRAQHAEHFPADKIAVRPPFGLIVLLRARQGQGCVVQPLPSICMILSGRFSGSTLSILSCAAEKCAAFFLLSKY